MKIAFVTYSQTGNTLSVVAKAAHELSASGHDVDLLKIEPKVKIEGSAKITKSMFNPFPKLDGYDAYIFSTFVEAFSLNRVMKFYLNNLDMVDGPCAHLTTQHLMKAWMGGNRAQKQMKQILVDKGATILGGAHVHWKEETNRESRIKKAVVDLVALF